LTDEAIQESGSEEEELESGVLTCRESHLFPIRGGVPRLTPESEISGTASAGQVDVRPAQAIKESFSAEWSHYDYEQSRTWHETLDARRQLFLKEVDCEPDALAGKVVLDAGCGNGSLSEGISRFGCEVIAVDVTENLEHAHHYFLQHGTGRTHFVHGDLLNVPLRSDSVDILYSSGVLHHNPDTREALRAVAPTVKPGGRIYIWVYHREHGLKFALQLKLRQALGVLPGALKRGFVYVWSIQSMLRQHLRTILRLNDEKDRLTWRERVIDLLDIYTPRYRWMHTQEEVHGWYQELGLKNIKTTEVRKWGFGVLGVDSRERHEPT
jgi:2-polyprenyl-3-methyl-5-hydroxy-6-metoxy-1,4-benzoquinol methylase